MIETKNLRRTFYTGSIETPVLKGIDFLVKEGEFVSIMGRSGAGKSTLLYQISLLDVPTGGSIVIEGREVAGMSESARVSFRLAHFGFVFQEYALLPELNATENVLLPLLMQGTPFSRARHLATDALSQVGLGHRVRNLPSQLSGGEQQRVAIARAIAHCPKVLFADEPTANLDSVSAKNIMTIFEEIHKGGQTIIMVTHEREYALHSERIVFIEDGNIMKEEKVSKKGGGERAGKESTVL